MSTIHEQIDEVLAAAVHNELSDEERRALHGHLVECAECRALHKEEQLMHRALGEVFSEEKPDFGFEKRMLYAFRQKAPQGNYLGISISNLIRSRSTQVVAAAALLLALMQMGRFLTGEEMAPFGHKGHAVTASPSAYNYELRPESAAQQSALRTTAADTAKNERQADQFPSEEIAAAAPSEAAAIASAATTPTATAGLLSKSQESAKQVVSNETDSAVAGVAQAATGAATSMAKAEETPSADSERKLVRNARADLEVRSFEDALRQVAALASEAAGYIATSSSEKQENGKLRGEVVVKVPRDNVDSFLEKLSQVGELKNQTLGSDDVTKQYADTDARLKNAQAMEQRLLEILKKKSDDINDLLAVEKELGRVRSEIEQMQGELKSMDSQVQFATVTLVIAEKEMDLPAAFLLKERAQLSLYAADVERTYNAIKALASPKAQITSATLSSDNSGRVSARINMLIVPEESDTVIAKVKEMGRVDHYQLQSERVARGGQGMSEEAKTERDKVQFSIALAREEQETALQQTHLRIRASDVSERAAQLRSLTEKQGGRIRNSSFARDPNGREFADISLRVPNKNYPSLMESLTVLGKLEDVTVHRVEGPNAQRDQANAPADVSIQVYSQGRIVSENNGVFATLRRTLGRGAGALMWSVQMIGVALAFLVPWLLPVVAVIWLLRVLARAREAKRTR